MRATATPRLLPPSLDAGPKRRWDGVFAFALLIPAWAFLWICRVYGPGPVRVLFGFVPLEVPSDLVLLLASVMAAVLVHEGGHLIAALMLGFRVLGGSVGPVQMQRLPGVWKISWSMKSFFTGSVSAVPRDMKGWRGAMMAVVAAGPVATLGSGLWAANVEAESHEWRLLQICFVQVSMLLFFVGLIPNGRQARLHNDARIFWDLGRGGRFAEEMELKLLLKQRMLAGERPQDYPRELLVRLAQWRGRPETMVGFAQAIVQWAIDSEEIETADVWDAYALKMADECGGRMQNAAWAASGCFDVIFRDDLESARNKLARVDLGALFPACFEYRARAAQQIALGRLHRAPGNIIRAQYALPLGIEYYSLERDLLARLHMRVLEGDGRRGRAAVRSALA